MADTAYIDPYRGEGPSRAPDQRVDARDPASTATRRLVSILIWLAAALGAALAYLAVATPLYSASTSIVLDARGSASEADAAPLTQDDNLIERQARLVSSPSVLSRVVASQNLEADPEFNAPPQPLVLLWRDILGLKPAVSPTASLEQRVLAALAERIDVKRSEGSSILDIDVGSSDPAKAARLADALAAAFVESQIAARPQCVPQHGRICACVKPRRGFGPMSGDSRP
jgi:succinoglycan biosynthesis transport protein ExoP